LRQKILAGALDPRPFLAIAADRAIDDTRVDRLHRGVIEPEAFDDAGAEILDHHIGLRQQRLQRLHVRGVLHVDGEAFLGAVDRVENGRVAADLRVTEIEASRQIPSVRTLDLDHPGAKILQTQRTIGTRQELAHIDDDKAIERQDILFRHFCYFSVLPTKSAGFAYLTV
jgi:hypothetical protein